ncbi:hypothetical protein [Microbacterium sp. 179-I 3D3 NHS]|uniref:hypothetical protein n=1 Tax=Microbacterium sp. 179-I 3D3 NHS TaxID=3142382 RepID=UPI00399F4446
MARSGKRVTLVSGANAEADAINDAIQQRRVDQGELDVRVAAWGIGQQRILVGDTVQTRRNDRLTGVENRAQWIVRGIGETFVDLVSVGDSSEMARVSPNTLASTCSSRTRPPRTACRATPPTRRWSVRMWMLRGSTSVSRAGG